MHEFQYCFSKDEKSTVDCIVLCSIIDKIVKQEKEKVHVSFVDFQKCSGLIYRNIILLSCFIMVCLPKIVSMLRNMYSSVKSCVKANGSLSNYFVSYTGVKQREPFLPLLFIFFVSDMYENLKNDNSEAFTLGELQIIIYL